ncbi:MAG: LacI family DNA-binding transcriptional regulator [Candidatus Brachytrichaceae bacterium NZ_4S206]|jgi:DNA-binding LacI/PurR family transcriptional regulator
MVTIWDVAREAGVSPSTVSNVIHGRPVVKPDTRQRVLEAIAKLDYHPSRVAQGLRQQASRAIGFLVLDPNPRWPADPLHAEVLAGMSEMATEHDYSLLLDRPPGNGHLTARELLQPFRSGQIDAAVVALAGTSDSHQHVLDALNQAGVLFAVLEREVEGECAYSVMGANEDGAYVAAQKLIRDGRRRIAFLDSTQMWPAIELRLSGYRRAMREAGLEANILISPSPDWTSAGGAVAMRSLLERCERERLPCPNAVLAGNDVLAVGAMHVLRERGLRIPADVAVIGFDDFEFARYVDPPLTTVRLPAYEMGKRAAELLIAHLEGHPAAQRRHVLPTELIVRQSG